VLSVAVLPSLSLSRSPPPHCHFVPPPCPVIADSYGPGAPAFHLTSSGSSAWVWVLHFLLLLLLLSFSPCPGHRHPLLASALWLWLSSPHRLFPHPQFHARDPPLEQVLVGLGWGGVVCCSSLWVVVVEEVVGRP
jgi:hypothetical protein